MDKIATASTVLASFTKSTIEKRRGGWYVCWDSAKGKVSHRWQCSGQDFYPTWSNKWGHGGTACTALSQLIRWLRDQPVVGIASWRHWASERCGLVPTESVGILLAGGYPKIVKCVLCDIELKDFDWWRLNGVSGPCCWWTEGCRQKTP